MIVAGFSYYAANAKRGEKGLVDVVVVGNGDRAHADALILHAPADDQQVVVEYFRPLVEGGRPAQRGAYTYRNAGSRVIVLWWKEVT